MVDDHQLVLDGISSLIKEDEKINILGYAHNGKEAIVKINELKPDVILVLGDRFEIFSAVSAAMIARIPIAHCHGGEATEGLIDESIRHSITKMSHLHFCSTDNYKKRIIQLGESPDSVHNVGALGIENINKLNLFLACKKNMINSCFVI